MATNQTRPQSAGADRIGEFLAQAQQAWRLLGSSQVPLSLKVIPVLAALYVVSPIDLVPDMALGLGQLDDIAVLVIGLRLFTSLAARYANEAGPAPASSPNHDREVTAPYRIRED